MNAKTVLTSLCAVLLYATEAAAQIQFAELGKRHLPADRGFTPSIVAGDADGDGDLDLFVGGQGWLYYNDGAAIFVDATAHVLSGALDGLLALGDVDGDGDLDVIRANSIETRCFRNDGSGTFAPALAALGPGFGPDSSMTLGDVDRDGDLDLLIGRVNVNRLYLNNGSGDFTDVSATQLPPFLFTSAFALGDVDRDGDLDAVVGQLQQSHLLRNDGSGRFVDEAIALASLLPIGTPMALGDVDGDGDLDLVTASTTQSLLYLNDGTGHFQDATLQHLPATNGLPSSIALADLDGDGDLDLMLGSLGQNRLLVNNGLGVFADATSARLPPGIATTDCLAVADLDGDGDLDIVVGNSANATNWLYLNDGGGFFVDATRAALPTDPSAFAAVLGDLDRDGDLDMVLGNARLYRNDGSGSLRDATAGLPDFGANVTALALGDVDLDGDLDLVVGRSNLQSLLYLNAGDATFVDATSGRLPARSDQTTAIAIGDVDRDGDLDLVVGNILAQNRLYLNNSVGQFVDATATNMPPRVDVTSCIALGDLDRDGDLDMVLGTGGAVPQSGVRIYENNNQGLFLDGTSPRMPPTQDATQALALGDVDGDGDLDLVVGTSSQRRLYLNDSRGFFTDAPGHLPAASSGTSALALGDVDGDGDLDMILALVAGRSRLYLNDGTGTFVEATTALPVDSDMRGGVVLADLDRDGDVDVVGARHVYQNLQRQLDAPYLLRSGRDYRIDVYARFGPPRLVDVALPYFSLGAANVPLPPLGTLGIDYASAVALPPFLVPQPAGVGSLTIAVPSVPTLAGLPVHLQALLVQYPTQDRLTNAITDVIVR